MNLKSDKGFISELLTFIIIIMLVILFGIIGYYVYDNIENEKIQAKSGTSINKEKNEINTIIKNDNNTVNVTNTTNTTNTANNISYDYNTLLNPTNSYESSIAVANNKQDSYISNTYQNDYNRFYYNQINDYAKQIYDVMYKSKDYLKTGTYVMNIPSSVSDVLYEDDGKQVLTESFQQAIDAFRMDNPEFFYVAFNEMILTTETTTYGSSVTYELRLESQENDSYLTDGVVNETGAVNSIKNVEYIKEQVISNVYGSQYNKIKLVHDWIIDNIEYDSSIAKTNTHNLYGAIVEKEAVCDGYARAFKYFMDELRNTLCYSTRLCYKY